MTSSISYRLSNLVWIEGMQINEWMNIEAFVNQANNVAHSLSDYNA